MHSYAAPLNSTILQENMRCSFSFTARKIMFVNIIENLLNSLNHKSLITIRCGIVRSRFRGLA